MTRHLFDDKKSTKQIAIYRKHRNLCIDEANAHGLAIWKQKDKNGAWDRQNFIDNFGEEEEEVNV